MGFKMNGWSGYQNSPLNKKEKFKPHNMYDKKKAETHKEHLELKEKGYGHTPLKEKSCDCWKGYSRAPGTKPCAPGSCKKSPNKLTDAQYNKSNKEMRSDYKEETGKTLGNQLTSGTDPRRVSFAARFGGANDPVKDENGELTKHGHALKRWGFSSNAEARAFANKHKKQA